MRFRCAQQACLDHLGIQVESGDELQEVYGRLKQAGSDVLEVATTTSCKEVGKIPDRGSDRHLLGNLPTTGESTLYGDSSKAKSGEARIAHSTSCCAPGTVDVQEKAPCEALHVRALLPVLSVRMTAALARKHLEEVVVLEDDTDTMVALAGRAWCRS